MAQELAMEIACCESAARNGKILAAWRTATKDGDTVKANLIQTMSTFYSCGNGDGTRTMTDNSVNLNAGGNITGVAAGTNASFKAGDITVYNGAVDSSQHLSSDLKTKLKDARAAIESLAEDPDVKSAILDNFGRMTQELEKPEPKTGILSMCWNAISSFAAKAKPILDLGLLLAKTYPSAITGLPGA